MLVAITIFRTPGGVFLNTCKKNTSKPQKYITLAIREITLDTIHF